MDYTFNEGQLLGFTSGYCTRSISFNLRVYPACDQRKEKKPEQQTDKNNEP